MRVVNETVGAEGAFTPVTSPARHIGKNRVRHQVFFQWQLVEGRTAQLLIRQCFGFWISNHPVPFKVNQVRDCIQGLVFFQMTHQLIQGKLAFRYDQAMKKLFKQFLFVIEQVSMTVKDAAPYHDM